MAFRTGGAPAGAGHGARTRAGGGPVRRTRREAARWLLASAAVVCAPLVTASRPAGPPGEPADTAAARGGGTPAAFDETYRGRRIQGMPMALGGRTAHAARATAWHVTVDGRPLHLMRRADGTWLSMVDHYGWYRTPLEATRAAVDELGPRRRLRDLAPGPLGGGHLGREAEHGVRA
ncbi:tyrosinase co-factor [Streptomyces zinciresistens K42]|uniref:Tyrosinase co-factor n=1 Tax=Streptomyces zinciresistens K42 TaxID=700597 RepID=G2GHC5_9ACTN|nr:tyrosinase family oxidase copper chaperone [Streptomyces zinciresistens]EGX57079.1 tyrosinase co-factor [Streptomyces zinciresistens K42]